ncbi:MAG: hypothetical protein HC822_10555 [Oscillochloris sp.]|nr:hypothetical protein [Oscillochloris sp.]
MTETTSNAVSPVRLRLLLAVAAGLCWAAAISLLLFGNLAPGLNWLAPARMLFSGLVVVAGMLTFVPLERGLGLPGLTVEGVIGSSLLLSMLAFVPAPTGSLLELPDLPVYTMLLVGLMLSGAAVVRPFLYAVGQRIFSQRARARDVGRVRRQSYEFGVWLAALTALAGLRVLNWVSLLLITTAFVIAELLLLSLFKAEPE